MPVMDRKFKVNCIVIQRLYRYTKDIKLFTKKAKAYNARALKRIVHPDRKSFFCYFFVMVTEYYCHVLLQQHESE